MTDRGLSVVTGAFGYTGRHIARRLLDSGEPVKTLTGHPARQNPFGDRLSVGALDFDDPEGLARSLEGATTLYNTYWIRFARGPLTFDKAVENTEALIEAAENAGVQRLVHISITSASSKSPLPYFRGKGLVEEAIARSGLSHAIVRPTVIFGSDDVLVNNIAWALRRFPFFAIYGSGDYSLQPVFVEDVARMAVAAGQETSNQVIDAIGPETLTFEDLVRVIARGVRSRARLVHVRPSLALALVKAVGLLVNDVVLTRHEVEGLMAGLLVGRGDPPTGETRFSEWLDQNADGLGRRYRSELRRHYS